MLISPFQPFGNTVSRTTNSGASVSQSCQITATNLGLTATFPPTQVLCIAPASNTASVWLSFTTATGTITIPTAGTGSSVGTPQAGLILLPGAYVIFTLTAGPTLWVQDISTGTSQGYFLTFGEGA